MRLPNLLFVLCIGLIVAPIGIGSAHRQRRTRAAESVRCDVSAYVVDQDPAGLNVRSGPNQSFKVIRRLPNQKVEGIRVHITGTSGDWVRIDKAMEQGGDPDRILFHGSGWVYSSLLGVSGMAITEGGTNLYQDKSTNSSVVIRVPGADDSLKIRGCAGRWMFVEYKDRRGWAAPGTLCANPLTTCV